MELSKQDIGHGVEANYVDSMTPEEREEQRKLQETVVVTGTSAVEHTGDWESITGEPMIQSETPIRTVGEEIERYMGNYPSLFKGELGDSAILVAKLVGFIKCLN